MRDSFIFYRSFLNSIQHLEPNEQLELFHAIVCYGLDQDEPEMSRYVRAVWESIKPQLDANQRKYENGCKGGKPKPNQSVTTPEPKPNQDLTTPEPPHNLMYNDNGNDNENDNANEECKGVKPKRDCSVLFGQFWAIYPRKTNKQSALKAFAKLKDEDQQKAISNITRLYSETPVQFIPHAATYINQARWEDEAIKRTNTFANPPNSNDDEPLPSFR
jgi:hypothetical protein